MSGLRIRLEIADDQEGKRCVGTLSIRNDGDSVVRGASPLSAAALNIVVLDHLWNLVRPEALGKVHVAFQEISLDPGEELRFDLEQLAFISGTGQFGYEFTTGLYFALALYHPGTARLPEQSTYPAVAASEVASFRVGS